MKSSARVAAPLLALVSAGCVPILAPAPLPLSYFVADARDLMVVRRVLVMPLAGERCSAAYLNALRESFVAELAGLHRFQIVSPPRHEPENHEVYSSEEHGRISTAALVDLGKRYQVDGIVLGRVTSFRPYLPPVLGMQLQLISVHSGEAVWVVDETFDSSRRAVRDDMVLYKKTTLAPEPSLHAEEMIQLSPRQFGRYVCSRLASTLRH